VLALFSDATTKPILGCTSKNAVTAAAAVSEMPSPLGIMALVDATISVIASAVGSLRFTDSDKMENINHSLAMLSKVMLIWIKYKISKYIFDIFARQATYTLESDIAVDMVIAKTLYGPDVMVVNSIKPTVNQTSMPRTCINELLLAPAFFLKYSKRIIRAPGMGSRLAKVPYEITVMAS